MIIMRDRNDLAGLRLTKSFRVSDFGCRHFGCGNQDRAEALCAC